MRVVMTTDTIGGVWTMTRELTQQLLDRGHAVALVSFGRRPNAEQESWCRLIGEQYRSRFRFHASEAALEWMQDNVQAFSGGVEVLSRVAEEFQADLLHSHQFCWGALPGDLPRLITAHSDVMSWSASCRPKGFEQSDWLTRYMILVQCGLDSADWVVSPTDWMRTELLRYFQVRCEIAVIPNGRTVPAPLTMQARKLQAVSAGRLWDEAKDIQTLLEIASPLPILVAGEESFESASAPSGSIGAVGILDESALFEVFRQSSIYIATSVYEPFGLAPLEAALCGCAVVARNLASLREVWADAALFYETSDELTALLCELMKSPELLRVAQDQAHSRARQFSATRMAEQYLALYESLLSSMQMKPIMGQELAKYGT